MWLLTFKNLFVKRHSLTTISVWYPVRCWVAQSVSRIAPNEQLQNLLEWLDWRRSIIRRTAWSERVCQMTILQSIRCDGCASMPRWCHWHVESHFWPPHGFSGWCRCLYSSIIWCLSLLVCMMVNHDYEATYRSEWWIEKTANWHWAVSVFWLARTTLRSLVYFRPVINCKRWPPSMMVRTTSKAINRPVETVT